MSITDVTYFLYIELLICWNFNLFVSIFNLHILTVYLLYVFFMFLSIYYFFYYLFRKHKYIKIYICAGK
uniref:Uncharacterized protein n=1 Tax=Strongyloides papillosus TaxID=174720 RepID=A0A0N5B565_STREA